MITSTPGTNGNLEIVTVTFPRLYATKPLDELAGTVREVVAKEFKQTPETIVLAFAFAREGRVILPAAPALLIRRKVGGERT